MKMLQEFRQAHLSDWHTHCHLITPLIFDIHSTIIGFTDRK